MKKQKKILLLTTTCSIIAVCIIAVFSWYVFFLRGAENGKSQPRDLSDQEKLALEQIISKNYPQTIIQKLPYNVSPVKINLHSTSAILIDASNGSILYEKNADDLIPPASMTKLVVMYLVFQEVATGRISLNDIVHLPQEAWAENAPPGSSLMFLGRDQIVTLRELLQGLAVASGNDAAIAVAMYVSGSVSAFIEKMNEQMKSLNLTHTHFVEPSGYSELNMTTAREFITFARFYIQTYPESLRDFHSLKSISYPQRHNLPDYLLNTSSDQNQKIPNLTITQQTTNKALSAIEGADGLKTGFIYESGYNLALTVTRNQMRILSVTMGGPGRNSYEGNLYRTEDAKTLTEWAFQAFSTNPKDKQIKQAIPVLYGNESLVYVRDAYTSTLTIPNLKDDNGNLISVTRKIIIPKVITGELEAGQVVGKIVYTQGDYILQEIPLIVDRPIVKANIFKQAVDRIASLFI